jgi:hypothetical protein
VIKILALVMMSLCSDYVSADDVGIDLVPLSNRPASEIIALLTPLLDNGTQLTDNGTSLLVKATPDQLKNIKALIQKLDVRQTNLIVSVMESQQVTADQLNADAGIVSSDPEKSNANTARTYQTQAKDDSEATHVVRTLEGVPAFIKVGQSDPQQNFSAYGYPTTMQYKETSTGFSVTPRLVGQQVLLNVSPWSETMNGQGQVKAQQAQATLRINLGEWVELGGVGQNANAKMNGTAMKTYQIDKNTQHILIKVDRID